MDQAPVLLFPAAAAAALVLSVLPSSQTELAGQVEREQLRQLLVLPQLEPMSLAIMRYAAVVVVMETALAAVLAALAVAAMEPELEQQVLLAVPIQAAVGVPEILVLVTAARESLS